ncbi:MAG: NAD-dependent epimerase/dehydratase family protein [Saccharofermentans sp.]|nr:NAD-dependent epimerase/dehydratase family protein [Saccharofermentans sp.]
MKILVIGGTRFFGKPMVRELLYAGHDVTVATRGLRTVPYNGKLDSVIIDKTDPLSVSSAFAGKYYDVIIDKVAYSSNDVKSLVENAAFGRYIQMSSCSVYQTVHAAIKEEEFDASGYELKWIDRPEDYSEGKRQAECAALKLLGPERCLFVRYPVVVGENDYTGRLQFYVDHIINDQPMNVDNIDAQIPFIHEREAGLFIAHLASSNYSGAVNGSSHGTISPRELIDHIENTTHHKAIIDAGGDPAPYNGIYGVQSFCTEKAGKTGFVFSNVYEWIYNLLDFYCYS